jgi:hypothetical protein
MKPAPAPSTYRPGGQLDVKDDTVHDPYFQRHKPAEPAGCSVCGAVFRNGRWQWLVRSAGAHLMRCPACSRIHDDMPAGWVTMEGEFARTHAHELLELARNVEAREKAAHPPQRIIAVERDGPKAVLTTTGLNRARGIGGAFHRAYKGELAVHYSADEYRLRVSWRR